MSAPKQSEEQKKVRPGSLREDALNLPNALTMMRIVLIPVVLFLIAQGDRTANFWAGMVYAVTALTDFVDGWLARKKGLVSVLGKFLDPLADKLLVMAALVFMLTMDRVPEWVVILILARELSITSLRVIAMSEGVVIAAGQGGKEKTALQMLAILFLIFHYPYNINFGFVTLPVSLHDVGLVLLYLSLVFAITSAGEYFTLFVEAVEKKEERLAKEGEGKKSGAPSEAPTESPEKA